MEREEGPAREEEPPSNTDQTHRLEGGEEEPFQESTLYDEEMEHLMGETLLGRQGHWRHGLCSTKTVGKVIMASVCPCYAAGRITTLLEREQPFRGALSFLKLGCKGLQGCLGSALLALMAPLPICYPALACWHLSQRRRLMHIYNFKADPGDCCTSMAAEGMRAVCCLPCSLGQELDFLESEEADGILRFPWESGEAWDLRMVDRQLPTFKVIVMGDRGVGKSSLFGRLLGKSFKADEPKEDTTVNMGLRVFHSFEKVPAGSIEFWDVPSEEYRAVEGLVFKNVHVIILTFTLLKKASFDYIKEVYSSIFQRRAEYSDQAFKDDMGRRMQKPVPAVLVAMKCDLFDESVCSFYDEVMDFAGQNNLVFIKVSSRTGLGVAKVFKVAMNKLVVKKENLEPIKEEHLTMQR